MTTITRTLRQWGATARFLSSKEVHPFPHLRDHALAAKIRQAVLADPYAHPDSPLAIALTPAEAATLERATPNPACLAEIEAVHRGFWDDVSWTVYGCPSCRVALAAVGGGRHWGTTSCRPRAPHGSAC